ncbi:GspH/FimT family pseudopilin [Sulfuriferula nivalis]|uniref:Type II secretion system protein H n=1 Tax=Sulfuriferula nivalis TaxID=2675298 RepID=A0A809SE88_9PROT|nr:GspH/FimT family pseudopilin [Sulfuriferula nivalis]BBP01207.1 prepilin-type N-terminal cleavage/methylation domain-containing protein [Sulfuriferula nivalis]
MNIPIDKGFTLIELLITISIGAILLAIAIPGYQSFVSSSRMTAQSNDFLSALQLARSEAVKRGRLVSVCKSADGATCAVTGTWAQGWIVFTDSGVVGTVDGTDAVIRVFPAISGNSTLVGSINIASFLSYQSTGSTSLAAGSNEVVSLCPFVPATVAGRDIQVSASGRARVQNPPAVVCP